MINKVRSTKVWAHTTRKRFTGVLGFLISLGDRQSVALPERRFDKTSLEYSAFALANKAT